RGSGPSSAEVLAKVLRKVAGSWPEPFGIVMEVDLALRFDPDLGPGICQRLEDVGKRWRERVLRVDQERGRGERAPGFRQPQETNHRVTVESNLDPGRLDYVCHGCLR